MGVAKNLLQVQGVYKSEEHQAQVITLQPSPTPTHVSDMGLSRAQTCTSLQHRKEGAATFKIKKTSCAKQRTESSITFQRVCVRVRACVRALATHARLCCS